MSGAVVVGTSIVALKYANGIMFAADMKISIGSSAKYHDVQRLYKINNKTVIGFTGEMSDAQYITDMLKRMQLLNLSAITTKEDIYTAKYYHHYLSRLFYMRRCRINPYLASTIIGGITSQKYDNVDDHVLVYSEPPRNPNEEYKVIDKEDLYLGYIDIYGTQFTEDYITTGYGRYFALTLLRNNYKDNMSEEEARNLLIECMKVLFYRDCCASDKIQIVKVTSKGVEYEEPLEIDANFNLLSFVFPSSMMPTAGCFW